MPGGRSATPRGCTPGAGPDGNEHVIWESNVDGFNLPMDIEAAAGAGGQSSGHRAQRTSTGCPAFGTDEYCCRGRFASSATCWPSGYWGLFKAQCPQAYSYAYDGSSTFTCNDGVDYQVTFCPSSGMSYEPHREQQWTSSANGVNGRVIQGIENRMGHIRNFYFFRAIERNSYFV